MNSPIFEALDAQFGKNRILFWYDEEGKPKSELAGLESRFGGLEKRAVGLIVGYGFPTFEYALPSEELIEVETTAIGPEVGRFLWTNRSIDLIAQAFVLFAAAVCCLALLRGREKK